jgi:hypothetical protein
VNLNFLSCSDWLSRSAGHNNYVTCAEGFCMAPIRLGSRTLLTCCNHRDHGGMPTADIALEPEAEGQQSER